MSRASLALTLPFVLLACTVSAPASPSPSSPRPTAPTHGSLYLRAWLTQALAPEDTFIWLPMLTVSDGVAIDGNVAVPAIYPGPLLILPNARAISDEGQAALVEQARQLGLLGGQTDFTGDGLPPGAQTAHILFVVEDVQFELFGDPFALGDCPDLTAPRCLPEPGTPAAFSWYWQRLSGLEGWLAAELGPISTYEPQRVALMTRLPDDEVDPSDVLTPQPVEWPLDTPLTEFGEPVPVAPDARCGTVSGTDLETLLPILRDGNQLTRFVDGSEERVLSVRVLVPGEPSPCADEA